MENNSSKVLTIIYLAIIVFCFIFIFFILNGNNDNSNITKTNYTKEQILDLIKAEDNKNNYEVEFSVDGEWYNKKYFNKKMVTRSSILDNNHAVYIDFEKDTVTTILEDKKAAILSYFNEYGENYMDKIILEMIES